MLNAWPNVVLLGHGEDFTELWYLGGGPSRRSFSHWECPLEGSSCKRIGNKSQVGPAYSLLSFYVPK